MRSVVALDAGFPRSIGVILLSLIAVVSASCGSGQAQSSAVEITEANLRDNTVVVSGTWTKGVSTPPACRLLESRDGKVLGRFSLDRAAFDGKSFSLSLALDEIRSETSDGYYVRCMVTLDSAKSASDTAPVNTVG